VQSRTQQLEQSAADAQRANAAKSEFLARMSHEIRTPMNGVLGMLEILQTSNLTALQAHYARTAQVSALALLQIINDILDFSKIEAGKLVLESLEFDLQALLQQLRELWSPEADRPASPPRRRRDAPSPAA